MRIGWRLVVTASLVLSVACGAKTGLGVPGPEPEGMDAAAPGVDAGPLDATAVPDVPPGVDACVDSRLTFMVTPTVMLIVDQSGSMSFELTSGSTRWDVLRSALVGRMGLVTQLEDRVRFGLALYSARSELGGDGGPPIGPCPLITDVRPTLGNLGAIRSTYDASDPIEDTPTGDAIDAVRLSLRGEVDPRTSPTIFILATDGEPDRCEELDPQNGQAEAVAAAEAAFAEGIRTFVVAVGEDVVSRGHLQDMANAGVGAGLGDPPAEFWEVESAGGLRRALREIVRNEASCEILLDRRIVRERACLGTVVLNGRPLTCDDPDGWRAADSRRIEILGEACDEIAAIPGSTIETVFPCEALE